MNASLATSRATASSRLGFHLLLAIVLGLVMWSRPPTLGGDVEEYLLLTVALASHATPHITGSDIARAKELAPALTDALDALTRGIATGDVVPQPGFHRTRNGRVGAIHFFGYSALAAVPYRLLDAAGLSPLRCFQVVNLCAVFVLGACLLRVFASGRKAAFGVVLFMLCGGALYWNWTGPECLTAASLLSSMPLFVADAPLAAGVLAGVASLQNPSVAAFCVFAPLLRGIVQWRRQESCMQNLQGAMGLREWCGIAIAIVLFAIPNLFSLWAFGVPNVILSVGGASQTLVSLQRLRSYFLDLNQGMVVGVPALFLALLLWSWRTEPRGLRARGAAVVVVCVAMTLVFALPALAVFNWNSGGRGAMRYAFWGAMPVLFAFLWLLRQRANWPVPLVAMVVALQAGAAIHQTRYGYLEFSPLARWVMSRAPGLYNPDREVFAERSQHGEALLDPDKVYVYRNSGLVAKVLYRDGVSNLDARVCGSNRVLANGASISSAGGSWRYLDGPVECLRTDGDGSAAADYRVADFELRDGVQFPLGWGAPEHGGGIWDGIWSDGANSRILISTSVERKPSGVLLLGHYFAPHQRTRVRINGRDYGWRRLDEQVFLPLDGVQESTLTIDLTHQAEFVPPGEGRDGRKLALFLHRITLR